MNKLSTLQIWLHGFSALSMAAFVYFFVSHNAPGFTNVPVIALLGGTYVAVFLLANPGLLGGRHHIVPPNVSRVLYAATALGLPVLFLNATVWDYYQPISLYDDAIFTLAASWLLLIISSIIALVKGQDQFAPAAIVALLGTIFVLFVHMTTNPVPSEGLQHHVDLFVGEEDGYENYRIPALLVLPAGSLMADGTSLKTDRLVAMAEARLNGALDTGAIDLVQKISDDGGQTWSAQQVICTYRKDGERGKCGNATPVFDTRAGVLWLAYNLSGIPDDLPKGPRPHSAHIMRSADGGMTWSEGVRLPFDNVVFGPGHGIQKQLAPALGRLVLPGNSAGSAMVIYSDDRGKTWQSGAALGAGNENEIAELSDGRLYMAARHVAPVGRPPKPNGRLYAHSLDAGETWESPQLDSTLQTPVCQASVLRRNDSGGLLFSNPADPKARVQMTVRASADDGKNWSRSFLVYPGPAGYSQLGMLSGGDAVLLYERGDMAYSEMISFARIGVQSALLAP
ncbi:MAG: sialidase family protein [Halioglobus sp.]